MRFLVSFAKFLKTPFFRTRPWDWFWNIGITCNIDMNRANPFHATGLFLYPLKTSENLENSSVLFH